MPCGAKHVIKVFLKILSSGKAPNEISTRTYTLVESLPFQSVPICHPSRTSCEPKQTKTTSPWICLSTAACAAYECVCSVQQQLMRLLDVSRLLQPVLLLSLE
jgi:hypothetical protein